MGVFEKNLGSGVWWVRYADQQGKIHREKVGPKSLARKVYEKRKVEVREEKFLGTKVRPLTLEEAVDDFLSRRDPKKRYFRMEKGFGKFWKRELGEKRLNQIVPRDIESSLSNLSCSRVTANRYLAFLKTLFSDAIKSRLVRENPVKRVKMARENKRIRYLTEEEERALMRELEFDPEAWAAVEFAINTGLRRGEQFNLRWEDVDFRNRFVRVRTSKNGEGRTVPLNSQARMALGFMRLRHHHTQHDRVFPRSPKHFYRKVFSPAVERAGIRDLKWHDLRHTFASRLAMAGVGLQVIKELMGHKSITMTLRYAHLSSQAMKDAVEKLGGTIGDTDFPKQAA